MQRKIFKGRKKKKSTTTNTNNTNQNCAMHVDSENAYNIFGLWCDITNCSFDDFYAVLKLTNLILPITVISADLEKCQLFCKDKNETSFSVTFDYKICYTYSTIIISFENESFHYTITNKSHNSTNPPEINFKMHQVKSNDSTYQFDYNLKEKTIVFSHSFFNTECKITIEPNALCSSSLLNTLKSKYDFDEFFAVSNTSLEDAENCSTDILNNFIKTLNLTFEELKLLKITAEHISGDTVYSKVVLDENKAIELVFSTTAGYYNLYSTGKLIFTTKDKNISFTVNDTSKAIYNEQGIFTFLEEVVIFAHSKLEKMKTYNENT